MILLILSKKILHDLHGYPSTFTSTFTGEWAAEWQGESGDRFFENAYVDSTPAERVDYPYSIEVTYDGSYSEVEIIPVVLNPYATTDVTVTLPDGSTVTGSIANATAFSPESTLAASAASPRIPPMKEMR